MHGYPHLSVVLFFCFGCVCRSRWNQGCWSCGGTPYAEPMHIGMSGCRLILFSFGRVCRWRCCDLTAVLAVAGVKSNTSFAIPTKGERLVDSETMWLAEPQPSSHDPGLGYRAQCATLLLTHWISDTSSKWRRLNHPADSHSYHHGRPWCED